MQPDTAENRARVRAAGPAGEQDDGARVVVVVVPVGASEESLLGHENVDKRLQRFLSVYPRLSGEHAGGFQHADLRYTNGFAILWVTPAPPTAPTSTKPNAAPSAPETHT